MNHVRYLTVCFWSKRSTRPTRSSTLSSVLDFEVLELRSEMDLLDELYQPIAWEPVQDGRENFQQNWCEVLLGVGAALQIGVVLDGF